MGCYKEISKEARLMTGDKVDLRKSLTPEKCISHCKGKGFKYAGLQFGYESIYLMFKYKLKEGNEIVVEETIGQM